MADIADLEAAFAKDPASAFAPLTEAYLQQGRFMEAMVVCKKGIKAEPDNLGGRLLLARVYAEQGKVPKAVDEIKKLLDIDDASTSGHFFLGQLHERAGRHDEAIEAFKRVVELEPGHEDAVAALKAKGIEIKEPEPEPEPEPPAAVSLPDMQPNGATGDFGDPIQPQAFSGVPTTHGAGALEQPRTTPPTGEMARPATPRPQSKAFESAFMGGYDPVAENKKRNKRLGLSFTLALFVVLLLVVVGIVVMLARASERAEQVAKFTNAAEKSLRRDSTRELLSAARSLEQALDLDDGHEGASSKRAFIYQKLMLERGFTERELTELVGVGGIKARVTESLAHAQSAASDAPHTKVASSIDAIRRAKPLDAIKLLSDSEGGGAFVDLWKARAHLRAGQTKEAFDIVEAHGKNVTHPGLLAFVASAYRSEGKRGQARQIFSAAIQAEGDHDAARAWRAMLSLELHDMTLAHGDMQHLADMGKDAIGRTQYGLMSLARGELARLNDREAEATSDFATAAELVPKHPDTLTILARGARAAGRAGDAVEKMESAVKADPTRVGSWALLIELQAEARKLKDAEESYSKAIALFPDHEELITARGYTWLRKRRKIPEGKRFLMQASKKRDDKNSRILTILGILELTEGKTDEAIATLTKAAGLKGQSGDVRAWTFTTLGRALARNKQDDDAKVAFAKAINANGTYPDAHYYFARVLDSQGSSEAAVHYQNAIRYGLDGKKKEKARERSK